MQLPDDADVLINVYIHRIKHPCRPAAEDPSPRSQLSPLECLRILYQMPKRLSSVRPSAPPSQRRPRSPENTHLVCDNTGANLVLQVLRWTMRPVVSAFPLAYSSDSDETPTPTPNPNLDRGIPQSPLAAGHLLASPWLNRAAHGGSCGSNDMGYIVCARTFCFPNLPARRDPEEREQKQQKAREE